jgi:hypothetical protein
MARLSMCVMNYTPALYLLTWLLGVVCGGWLIYRAGR